MHGDLCKLGSICIFVLFARLAGAQSIAFFPATPSAGQVVYATLSQPFNCAAQPPVLRAGSANTFTFDSTLPDGITHCPVVLDPPPTTSTFLVSLGSLTAGTYAITWNIYLHQSMGMPLLLSSTPASLTVAPGGAVGITITPGFTGNWFNHDQSGHGFSIEVLANNQMLAQWYTFDPFGGQAWIVATGAIEGNTAVLQGSHPTGSGAVFPPNFDPSNVQNQPWGTIIFTFTDCNIGQASWIPIVNGYPSGSMPITRLTMPAGLTCP